MSEGTSMELSSSSRSVPAMPGAIRSSSRSRSISSGSPYGNREDGIVEIGSGHTDVVDPSAATPDRDAASQPSTHVQQLHLTRDESQQNLFQTVNAQVNVGVDPLAVADMLQHARQAVESANQQSQRADDAELRAHQIYVEALSTIGGLRDQVLQLSSVVEGLQRDNQQLGQRLEQMQREASRHIQAREAEISRLRLAATRAADAQGGNSAEVFSIATPPVDAQTPVETVGDAHEPFADGSHVGQILEAISKLSDRINAIENSGQNSAVPTQISNVQKRSVDPPTHALGSSIPSIVERDVIDSKALQHLKIEPIPDNAAAFRSWKNALILSCAKCDISGTDAITKWINVSFSGDLNHLDETSDGFPRFDRSTRSLRVVPSIAVKVNGYIERCTRDGKAPRGRFILATIAKHFDLDRARGSMLTASALLSLEPAGLGVAQVQDFASKVTQTMSAAPSDELPSDRLLGEWLFSKVRNFRKPERHIENIKDSAKDSTMRGFDFLWGKLQDTLSYEREDLNAKDVQDHFRKMSPGVKASGVPAPKTPSPSPPTPQGAGSPPSLPSGLAAYAPPGGKGGDDSPSKKKGKGKGKKGTPLTKEQKAQKPCIFFQMDSGCHHGEKCEYAHVKTGTKPSAKPAAAKPKPKAMPAFAVAMIASAMAGVSQATNTVTVEWGADTCAGRHLASSKALGSQGIPSSMYNSCIGTSSDPIAFATGGAPSMGTILSICT